MSGFTTQQQQALERAYEILSEHFDGSVVVVLADCGENEPQEAVRLYWHGGRTQAIGMLEDAKYKLLGKMADEVQP